MKFKLTSSGAWHDDQDPKCIHFIGPRRNWIDRLWAGIRCDTCRRRKLILPHANDFHIGHMIIINGELYRYSHYGVDRLPETDGERHKVIRLVSVSTRERNELGLE